LSVGIFAEFLLVKSNLRHYTSNRETPAALRDRPAGLRLHFTQISFENVTQEKSLTLATAAVRLRRPSAT